MSISLLSNPIFSENINPKIVVIGGGLAGLTAAYRLHQRGMDVELYEARGRVGGRVFSINISGNIVELGAQNITDGGDASNILQLIHEFNLELTELEIPIQHSFFDGKNLVSTEQFSSEKTIDEKGLRTQLDKLKSSCRNMKEILDRLFEKDSVLYRSFATRLAAYEGGTVERLSSEYVETLFHMISGGISSVHQDDIVNLVSIKGGNSKLPEKIAELLGGKLHLNMPLIQVSEESNSTYMLTFKNGRQVRADILVLAIPCSVFEQITFQEGVIEKDRLDSMKSLPYGTNAKILIPFKGIPSKRIGLVDDHTVSFLGNESVLTMYCTGEASRFTDNEISDIYIRSRPSFDAVFGDLCFTSNTAIYAEDCAFVQYDSSVGFSWPNDPYARGSYSYIGAGQEPLLTAMHEENGEKFKSIFAPIKEKLYFIGEHTTTQEEIRGTMEAACKSGEKCVRAILAK